MIVFQTFCVVSHFVMCVFMTLLSQILVINNMKQLPLVKPPVFIYSMIVLCVVPKMI